MKHSRLMLPPDTKYLTSTAISELESSVVLVNIGDFSDEVIGRLLPEEEMSSGDRYRQPEDRLRHLYGHFLKRLLISRKLALPSQQLTFDKNDYGKPFCTTTGAPYFNISHSGDWVVLAISTRDEVGVDVEFARRADYDGVIRHICSEKQVEQYQASQSPHETFLNFWSQKEAVCKACGRGIAVGVKDIDSSGLLGEQVLTFMSRNYALWTRPWGGEGVLSYAFCNATPTPRVFRLAHLQESADAFEGMFFEL